MLFILCVANSAEVRICEDSVDLRECPVSVRLSYQPFRERIESQIISVSMAVKHVSDMSEARIILGPKNVISDFDSIPVSMRQRPLVGRRPSVEDGSPVRCGHVRVRLGVKQNRPGDKLGRVRFRENTMGGFFKGWLEFATVSRGRSSGLYHDRRVRLCFVAVAISLFVASVLTRWQRMENERKRLIDAALHSTQKWSTNQIKSDMP